MTPDTPEAVEVPPEDSQASFVRNTTVMSVGTALSRLTGFLRVAAMAYALGITETRLADAYNIANITPNIVYELFLGGVLSSVFVPVFVEWLQTRGRDEAWEVARRVLTIALIVLAAIALLGILLAPWIVRAYTFRVEEEREATQALATFFLRWFMPQIVFYGLGAVAAGLLNAHRRFAAPMFAPILNNLVVIATFLLFAAMPPPGEGSRDLATGAQKVVLAIGTTLGVVAMTAGLWPSLRRIGFRWRWRAGRHPAVSRIAHLAKWTVVYVVANQIGYQIVLVLAAGKKGWYTAYSIAFILFQLPHAIFVVSIFTALLPGMSARWAERDADGFRSLLSRGIRTAAAVVLPAAAGYVALSTPIVRLLLEHGVVEPASTRLVSQVLAFFALGLFPFSVFQVLLRAFYSMQDTRTPALINVAAVALNTVVNLLYFFALDLGVRGLALGHATAYAFSSTVALLVLRRRLGGIEGRRILAAVGASLGAAGATGLAAWATAEAVGRALGTATLGAQAVQVGTAVAAGVLVFLATALILRVGEVDAVWRRLTARWRR